MTHKCHDKLGCHDEIVGRRVGLFLEPDEASTFIAAIGRETFEAAMEEVVARHGDPTATPPETETGDADDLRPRQCGMCGSKDFRFEPASRLLRCGQCGQPVVRARLLYEGTIDGVDVCADPESDEWEDAVAEAWGDVPDALVAGEASLTDHHPRIVGYGYVPDGECKRFFECGGCGAYHPAGFDGDCRDSTNRFYADRLDTLFGPDGWEIVEEVSA